MLEPPKALGPSSTDASKAISESAHHSPSRGTTTNGGSAAAGRDVDYQIGPGVKRAVYGRPYERTSDDPLYRPLKIYALDPSFSSLEGAVVLVNVPYEPLKPGPIGKILAVHDQDENQMGPQINLNDPAILIRNGRDPSPSDQLFHQQMVIPFAAWSMLHFEPRLVVMWRGGSTAKRTIRHGFAFIRMYRTAKMLITIKKGES
jgi:hypothetical protein